MKLWNIVTLENHLPAAIPNTAGNMLYFLSYELLLLFSELEYFEVVYR